MCTITIGDDANWLIVTFCSDEMVNSTAKDYLNEKICDRTTVFFSVKQCCINSSLA